MQDLFGRTAPSGGASSPFTDDHGRPPARAPEDSVPSPSSPAPTPALTHVDARGTASMVDVGDKIPSLRTATASSRIILGAEAFRLVQENRVAKGDVLTVARIAGIQAAKQTSSLIPLCHSIMLNKVRVDFALDAASSSIRVTTEARCTGTTGVEMEALTAASVAALTIYDMCKAVDKGMIITDVMLETKAGGKGGDFMRGPRPAGY